ncbi:hypothetical protein ACVWY3_004592 [Bradyrhizobium sp. USDA 4486]
MTKLPFAMAARKKCMRTGIYIGPESGTNDGQAEKK